MRPVAEVAHLVRLQRLSPRLGTQRRRASIRETKITQRIGAKFAQVVRRKDLKSGTFYLPPGDVVE